MSRDRIFLIQPGFEDPKNPGRTFYCPSCNQIEGVLARHPSLAGKVDVERLPFLRPRRAIADLIGEDHQSLPVIVFGDELPVPADARQSNGFHFIDDTQRILELLAERHGAPYPH